jgi:antagonist of KipI
MGVRFGCPELKHLNNVSISFRRVAAGTIRFRSGKPILLLGLPIGGYPKIAHVITVDLGIAAQLRAGDHVRFSEVSLSDAHRLLLEREQQLELFRIGLSLHTS